MPFLRTPSGKFIEVPAGLSDEQAEALAKQQFPALFAPPTTMGGQVTEFVKGLPAGFAGGLGSAARGLGALLPDEMETPFARGVKAAEEALTPKAAAGYEDAFGRKLGEAVGSMGSFLLPAALTRGVAAIPLLAGRGAALARGAATAAGEVSNAEKAVVGIMAGASGAGEAREKAEQEGATAEQRGLATALGILPGLTDVLPIERLLKKAPAGTLEKATDYIKRALVTGGMEGAQEAAQNFVQNLIAQQVYKPGQELIEGVGEGALYGGTAGALVQGLMDLTLGRGAARALREQKARDAWFEKSRKAEEERVAGIKEATLRGEEQRFAGPVSMDAPIQKTLFDVAAPAGEAPAAPVEKDTPEALLRKKVTLERYKREINERAVKAQAEGDTATYERIIAQQDNIDTILQGLNAELKGVGIEDVNLLGERATLEKLLKDRANVQKAVAAQREKGVTENEIAASKLGARLKDLDASVAQTRARIAKAQPDDLLAGVPMMETGLAAQETRADMRAAAQREEALAEGQQQPDLFGGETDLLTQQQGLAEEDRVAKEKERAAKAAQEFGTKRQEATQQYELAETEKAAKRIEQMATDAPVETILAYTSKTVKDTPTTRKRVDALKEDVANGRLTPELAKLLGVALPEGAQFDLGNPQQAAKALPLLEARRAELEAQRKQEFPNKEVVRAGDLTVDGKQLAALEASLAQIKVLHEQATAAKRADDLISSLAEKVVPARGDPFVNVDRPRMLLSHRRDLYAKRQGRALEELADRLDTLRKGLTLSGTARAMAGSTTEGLVAKARAAADKYVQAAIMEVAHSRYLAGHNTLTSQEALDIARSLEAELAPLIDKAVSPRGKETTLGRALEDKRSQYFETAASMVKDLRAAKAAGNTAQVAKIQQSLKDLQKLIKTVTPKQDAIKRGFARSGYRSELADLRKRLDTTLDAARTPPRKYQEAPFELTAQTAAGIEAKQKTEKEGFPIKEAAYSTLYKQMQEAEKAGDTKKASIIRNKIRSLEAGLAAEERTQPPAKPDTSKQIDIIDGAIESEEKSLAAAQKRLDEKRTKRRNLTGAKREVERLTKRVIGLYILRSQAKGNAWTAQARNAERVLADKEAALTAQMADAKDALTKERLQQEMTDLRQAQRDALSLSDAIRAYRKVKWGGRKLPLEIEQRKLKELRDANADLHATDMPMWGVGQKALDEVQKAKAAFDRLSKLAETAPTQTEIAEAKRKEAVAKEAEEIVRREQHAREAEAKQRRAEAQVKQQAVTKAKEAGLTKEAYAKAAAKDVAARVAEIEKRLESKRLSKKGREVLEERLKEAKADMQGRQEPTKEEQRERQVEAAREGQERRQAAAEAKGRMSFEALDAKIREAERRLERGELTPKEQALADKRAELGRQLADIKEKLEAGKLKPAEEKALKKEAATLARKLKDMVLPLEQMRGQRDALAALRAHADKKKGKAVADIAMKGSRAAPMEYPAQVALYEARKPVPAAVLETLREDADVQAVQRLVKEGLATVQTTNGRKRVHPVKGSEAQFAALKEQYAKEYFAAAVAARQKAMQAAELKKLFDVEDTDTDDGAFRLADAPATGVGTAAAQQVADGVRASLPEGVKLTYAATYDDVPAQFKEAIEKAGADPASVQGMVLPNGEVLVIGAHHADIKALEETFAHELIGHYGVDTLLGPEGFKALVDRLYSHPDGAKHVARLAADLGVYDSVAMAEQGMLRAGSSKEALKLAVVRELVAHAAEGRPVKKDAVTRITDLWRTIIDSVKTLLERMGLKSFADRDAREIQRIIRQAHSALSEGRLGAYRAPSGEAAFSLRGGEYESTELAKHMFESRSAAPSNWGMRFMTNFIDRYWPVKAVAGGMQDSLAAAQMNHDLLMAGQRTNFVSAVAATGPLVREQITDEKTGQVSSVYNVRDGANLKLLAQTLAKAKFPNGSAAITEAYFTMYMVALRAEKVGYEKFNFLPAMQEELKQFKKRMDSPENAANRAVFDEARGIYNEYNRGLIAFAVSTGAISAKEGARLNAIGDYIPFYRRSTDGSVNLVVEGEEMFRVGDLKTQPHLHELVGDDTGLMKVFDSAITNTNMLLDMGLRNQATKTLATSFEGLDFGKVLNGPGPASTTTLRFREDGEYKHINIDTTGTPFENIPAELIVKGMEGIATMVPWYVRMLAQPAQLLRKAITLSPTYAMNQILKDSLSMYFVTGANGVPVLSALREVGRMYNGTSVGEEKLRRSGVLSNSIMTGGREDFSTILRQISAGGGFSPLAAMEGLGMKADASSRVVLYHSFLKQGLSEMEARIAAMEAINFNTRGLSPGMYHLSMMIPFFNAGIQSFNVLAKALGGKMPYNERLKVRQKLFTRGVAMSAMTLGYAAMVANEDWYKELPDEDRLRYWFFKLPGVDEPLRLPIPFEVGWLFKAVPEAVFVAANRDTQTADLWKALGRTGIGMVPIAPQNMIPAGVKPLVEVAFNQSIYTGKAVESQREQKLDVAERYRDGTTELAKVLGAGGALSPVQIDYLIRGYTAALGLEAVALLNEPITGFAPKPTGEAPEKSITQLPLVRTLFQPMDARGAIDRMYNFMAEADRKEATYKKLVEEGRLDEAERYLETYANEISYGKAADKFRKQMGELTKAERAIKTDATMSGREKRDMLIDLRNAKRDAVQAYAIGRV